jgi:ribosome-binding factor A
MANKSFKKEKIEGRLLQDLNTFLRTHVRDSRLKFISITKVEISTDFSYAKVYWDTFDDDARDDAQVALEKIRGKFRSMLAKTLKIRHTPELKFLYDSQFESENKIKEILEEESKKGKFAGNSVE